MERFTSLFGLFTMVGIAFLLSNNKQKIDWCTVGSGIALQILFGLFILKTDVGQSVFDNALAFFNAILDYTSVGAGFIFGSLADPTHSGFLFFTTVLPVIIFMSALMKVLYHIGLMQLVVRFTARIMVKVMGTSGAESLSAAANIFVGQTEAPLIVKPFIDKMTQSEIMALMTGGMATVAGSVLAAYVGMGIDAGHLLAASVMSAPAALVCAKLLVPETEESHTKGSLKVKLPRTTVNLIDAAATGAGEGLKLALNVAAMLLAFIALIAMVNGMLGFIGAWFDFPGLSLEWITGYLFFPVAWIIGVPASDCQVVGALLGTKLILNEFVAYLDLQKVAANMEPRSVIISTYALCGFANFASIAVQIGGIGSIAPNRRKDLAQLGIKSLIGGTLACLMTACIAGIFI